MNYEAKVIENMSKKVGYLQAIQDVLNLMLENKCSAKNVSNLTYEENNEVKK